MVCVEVLIYLCVREPVWLEHPLRVNELGPERGHDAGVCKYVYGLCVCAQDLCIIVRDLCECVCDMVCANFLQVCVGLCGWKISYE